MALVVSITLLDSGGNAKNGVNRPQASRNVLAAVGYIRAASARARSAR